MLGMCASPTFGAHVSFCVQSYEKHAKVASFLTSNPKSRILGNRYPWWEASVTHHRASRWSELPGVPRDTFASIWASDACGTDGGVHNMIYDESCKSYKNGRWACAKRVFFEENRQKIWWYQKIVLLLQRISLADALAEKRRHRLAKTSQTLEIRRIYIQGSRANKGLAVLTGPQSVTNPDHNSYAYKFRLDMARIYRQEGREWSVGCY